MADYAATCSLIHDEIYEILEKREEERHRFAPRGTVKHLFQGDRHFLLRKFFQSLASFHHETISEDVFVERVETRKLSNFWATLIFATCSIKAATTALRQLVAADNWPVPTLETEGNRNTFLPLSRAQLGLLLGSRADADRFFGKQACFCPVVLHNREEVIVQDAECQRLPYLEEEPIGEGSFGTVYRVKVAKNHFYDGHAEAAKAYNGTPQDMARKDYVIAHASRAKEEYKIMKKILSANFENRAHNIVQSLGCLRIGSSYSLFMPVAICDLHMYMMVHHPHARQDPRNKAEIVLSAAGLASGLHFLHSGIKTESSEELVCYHMDLTPSNVLVFVERGCHVWKLSDFGMARVKIRMGEVHQMPKNFNSLFIRREKPQDPSLPSTLNRRGEGTYLSPESIAAEPTMKTGSDVWSLGCVLSVVFAYLGSGASGVRAYADARHNHRKADGYDRFFLRGMHFSSSKVHPVIKHWHEKLSSEAMRRCIEEGNAFHKILTFLQDNVLKVDQNKRCKAKAVQTALENTYKMLQGVQENSLESTLVKPKMISSNVSPPIAKLVSQHLEFLDDFKGLIICPDASCLAYWTDSKIILYTSESLSFTRETENSKPSKWLLDETDCFLKGVCLTRRYLVASTVGQNYLYIFHLHGSEQVDPNLNSMRRIAFDMPAISNIAMSPNSQTLVFVMRNERDIRGPGILVYTSLQELLASMRNSRFVVYAETIEKYVLTVGSYSFENSLGDSVEPMRLSKSHTLFRNSIRLDWPAADIVQLTVSNEKDVYIVVRPELTAVSREHKIPIARVWADNVSNKFTIDTLNVVSLGFDGSTTAGFFTTFCVVNNRHTCALVTRGKKFHLQSFDEETSRVDDQRDIAHYRIVKLFNAEPTGRLFALGNISSKQQLLLMEVDIKPTLGVRELVKIPGLWPDDDVTAVAVEHGEKVRIIVASLTGVGRRVIFRITVPKQEKS